MKKFDSDPEYLKLKQELDYKLSESLQQILCLQSEWLESRLFEFNEVQKLEGKVRKVRLKQFKKNLIERLVEYRFQSVGENYKDVFKNEVMKLLSAK